MEIASVHPGQNGSVAPFGYIPGVLRSPLQTRVEADRPDIPAEVFRLPPEGLVFPLFVANIPKIAGCGHDEGFPCRLRFDGGYRLGRPQRGGVCSLSSEGQQNPHNRDQQRSHCREEPFSVPGGLRLWRGFLELGRWLRLWRGLLGLGRRLRLWRGLGRRFRLRGWLWGRALRSCGRACFLRKQLPGQLPHGGVAVFGGNGHTLLQRGPLSVRQPRDPRPVRLGFSHGAGNGVGGHLPGKAEIDRGAQGVLVRPGADAAPAAVLLRGREALLHDGLGGAGHIRVRIRVLHGPGRAEVNELRPAHRLQNDVVRADVPVDDPGLMHLIQRRHDGLQDPQGFLRAEPSARIAGVLHQVGALDILHHHVSGVVFLKAAVDAHDLRHRGELRQSTGFPQEPLPAGGVLLLIVGGEKLKPGSLVRIPGDHGVGEKLLDGHRSLQLPIPAQVRNAVAALPQRPSDNILPPQNRAGLQLMRCVRLSLRPAANRAHRLIRQLSAHRATIFFHTPRSLSVI